MWRKRWVRPTVPSTINCAAHCSTLCIVNIAYQVEQFAEDEPGKVNVVPAYSVEWQAFGRGKLLSKSYSSCTDLLWMFRTKNLTNLSRFSWASSTNLVVVPLPQNRISPPSMLSQSMRGR